MDDHGDERHAQVQVNHFDPIQVSHVELEYYNDVFPFLDAHDLMFYLYPVMLNWLSHPDAGYIDSYVFSLGTRWSLVRPLIGEDGCGIMRSVFSELRANDGSVDWNNLVASTDIFSNDV